VSDFPADIAAAIARRFPADDALVRTVLAPVLALTDGARVVRCVLHLATDLDRIADLATAAATDPRDVIWWAEYDGGERRLRDFSQGIESPDR